MIQYSIISELPLRVTQSRVKNLSIRLKLNTFTNYTEEHEVTETQRMANAIMVVNICVIYVCENI